MSTKDKKKIDPSRIINSGLLICLLIYATIATLLLFTNFFSKHHPQCVTANGDAPGAFHHPGVANPRRIAVPYLGADQEDFLALLTPPADAEQCKDMKVVSLATINEINVTSDGLDDVHACLDTLPARPTPSNCRIYSFDPSPDNILFELKMGLTGCRVHIITKVTQLNYGRVTNNTFLYPLHLSADDGPSYYSLDGYINLLSHETKLIHLVKTTAKDSEWRFLTTLFTSKTEAWRQILQIRMTIHVPPLTAKTRDEFSLRYLLLKGLPTLGFQLIYSKPLLLQGETKPEDGTLASRYETIWKRKN